jgi:hypothetical protein
MNAAGEKDALQSAEEAVLEQELQFFLQHEREWAREHRDRYVLIGKSTFGGFHPSREAALQAGIRAFGPVSPFLVRRVGNK